MDLERRIDNNNQHIHTVERKEIYKKTYWAGIGTDD